MCRSSEHSDLLPLSTHPNHLERSLAVLFRCLPHYVGRCRRRTHRAGLHSAGEFLLCLFLSFSAFRKGGSPAGIIGVPQRKELRSCNRSRIYDFCLDPFEGRKEAVRGADTFGLLSLRPGAGIQLTCMLLLNGAGCQYGCADVRSQGEAIDIFC